MLTIEKMKQGAFSPAERKVADYILQQKTAIRGMTIREISEAAYASPGVVIKLAKKMNFPGWLALKQAVLRDYEYLTGCFGELDANAPFSKNDGIMTITKKMAALYQTTIVDSLSLVQHDSLQQALTFMEKASEIRVFGNNVNLLISQDFAHKMNRIRKPTSISSTDGEQLFDAVNCRLGTCAIVISYSGETQRVLEILPLLQQRQIPVIAITSLGDNSLAQAADCTLNVTTREKLYSKIGNLSPNASIIFTLDCLYACIFSHHYERNLAHVIETSRLNDPRQSNTEILRET